LTICSFKPIFRKYKLWFFVPLWCFTSRWRNFDMGEDDDDLDGDIFDEEDNSVETEVVVISASFEADARRRLEDQLEKLRLKKLIQDYDFDM
jgi:hypothetical protein